MSLTKFCIPSETALRQLFSIQLFEICVLSLNGRTTPNSAVSDEIGCGDTEKCFVSIICRNYVDSKETV